MKPKAFCIESPCAMGPDAGESTLIAMSGKSDKMRQDALNCVSPALLPPSEQTKHEPRINGLPRIVVELKYDHNQWRRNPPSSN